MTLKSRFFFLFNLLASSIVRWQFYCKMLCVHYITEKYDIVQRWWLTQLCCQIQLWQLRVTAICLRGLFERRRFAESFPKQGTSCEASFHRLAKELCLFDFGLIYVLRDPVNEEKTMNKPLRRVLQWWLILNCLFPSLSLGGMVH